MFCPNAFIGSPLFFCPFSFTPKFFKFFAIYSFLLITADSTKIDGTFPSSNSDSDFLNSPSHSQQIHSSQFGQFEQTKTIEFVSNSKDNPDAPISPHPHHRHRNRRRHRRRLPFGAIGRFFAKLGKGGKVAAASADDVAAVGTKFARNGDKIDDFVVGGTRMGKNVGKGPPNGRGLPRRQQYRSYDAPSFNPYSLPNGEIRKARSKALTGANLALATGGIAAGIWYFSGENATLFIAIIIAIGLICILLAASLLAYCLLCRNKKRGYYAVNEEDIVMAFLKKMLFYMFC